MDELDLIFKIGLMRLLCSFRSLVIFQIPPHLFLFFLIPLNSLHNVTVHPLSDSATTSSFPLLRDHAPPPHQRGVAWSKYHNEPWLLLPWRRNQSEAQIGAVVVFRTLHHCGREAKHDTAVSARPLRRRNATYELILLSCGLAFYFLCVLLVFFFVFFLLFIFRSP